MVRFDCGGDFGGKSSDILKMFAYHVLSDSLKSNSRKIKTNQIKDGEREKGGGAKIPFKRSVLNANPGAYRRLSGLIGFGRPAEFGLYRPRLLPARPALAWPVGNTGLNIPIITAGIAYLHLMRNYTSMESRVKRKMGGKAMKDGDAKEVEHSRASVPKRPVRPSLA